MSKSENKRSEEKREKTERRKEKRYNMMSSKTNL